ncbi:unnamed protein product, partial [Rotaria socialis]
IFIKIMVSFGDIRKMPMRIQQILIKQETEQKAQPQQIQREGEALFSQ